MNPFVVIIPVIGGATLGLLSGKIFRNHHQDDRIEQPGFNNVGRLQAMESVRDKALIQSQPHVEISNIGFNIYDQLKKFGFPSPINDNVISLNGNFIVEFDTRLKQPKYTYECLTKDYLQRGSEKEFTRRDKEFTSEGTTIPALFLPTDEDYKGSGEAGLDRGHLATASNHKATYPGYHSTYSYTNVCPQYKEFNNGMMQSIEKHIAKNLVMGQNFEYVHVWTGPLFLPTVMDDGKKRVSYDVIGEKDIPVPTHFFKIIVTETDKGKTTLDSYTFPNRKTRTKRFEEFRELIDAIESNSGLQFFKNFKPELRNDMKFDFIRKKPKELNTGRGVVPIDLIPDDI